MDLNVLAYFNLINIYSRKLFAFLVAAHSKRAAQVTRS